MRLALRVPLRVHVPIWRIRRPQSSPSVGTSGTNYILYSYMDPFGIVRSPSVRMGIKKATA